MNNSHQNDRPKRNILIRLIGGIWRLITGIRQVFFNLIFLVIIGAIIAALMTPKEDDIPDSGALWLAPSGVLVEQKTHLSPSAQLLSDTNQRPQETLLRELITVIEHAASDNKITGLALQLDHLHGGGLSKLQELGAAIETFKASGKPVIAYSDNYTQQQYYLATYADSIYIHHMGRIVLTGYGLYRSYYKEAFDKLLVDFHVFKVGTFKDFIEPYTRSSMSEASKEHNSQWIQQLWGSYTDHVEDARALEPGVINGLINNLPEHLESTQGDAAKLAHQFNMVDLVGSRNEIKAALKDKFGTGKKSNFLNIPYSAYKKRVIKHSPLEDKAANIGLIVAKGSILDGSQPAGAIGGDSLSALIRQARENKKIKAIVLRIDSGGGSAFASEVIRQELQAARDDGKIVVVSMGSVAASGGYWIALSADEVWATPNTITGSIGVFALLPTLKASLEKLGIRNDGIGTTNVSGAFEIGRDLPVEVAEAYQQSVESIYDRFLKLVADGRNNTVEDVHKIAQGRVWTGSKAQELGLVDQLGTLNQAIQSAARLASISAPSIKQIKKPLSPREQLIQELIENTQASGIFAGPFGQLEALPQELLSTLKPILTEVKSAKQHSAPSIHATCVQCQAL